MRSLAKSGLQQQKAVFNAEAAENAAMADAVSLLIVSAFSAASARKNEAKPKANLEFVLRLYPLAALPKIS